MDGLAAVVTEQYELDPYSKSPFMFCGTHKDWFKAFLGRRWVPTSVQRH
ncbi:IS66 family insertion sequence element accessory protein TnpB [Lacticaseibacillus hulanensis]